MGRSGYLNSYKVDCIHNTREGRIKVKCSTQEEAFQVYKAKRVDAGFYRICVDHIKQLEITEEGAARITTRLIEYNDGPRRDTYDTQFPSTACKFCDKRTGGGLHCCECLKEAFDAIEDNAVVQEHRRVANILNNILNNEGNC